MDDLAAPQPPLLPWGTYGLTLGNNSTKWPQNGPKRPPEPCHRPGGPAQACGTSWRCMVGACKQRVRAALDRRGAPWVPVCWARFGPFAHASACTLVPGWRVGQISGCAARIANHRALAPHVRSQSWWFPPPQNGRNLDPSRPVALCPAARFGHTRARVRGPLRVRMFAGLCVCVWVNTQ